MNNKLLFGIITYRELFWETETFKNLLKSFLQKNSSEIHICIYDNTDVLGWDIYKDYEQQDRVKVHYFHDANNQGISTAINYFGNYARTNALGWMVFLDQDTQLPTNFYDVYRKYVENRPKHNIAFPKVFFNNKLMSPSRYHYYRAKKFDILESNEIALENVTAINSGLLVNTSFFIKNKGYNNNLRIDFCDHEFIERLNHKNIKASILDVRLNQNFSAETDDLGKALKRYRMYVLDLKQYEVNKNKLLLFVYVDLPHLCKLILQYKNFDFFRIRFFNKKQCK